MKLLTNLLTFLQSDCPLDVAVTDKLPWIQGSW